MKGFLRTAVGAVLVIGLAVTVSAAAPNAVLSQMKGKVEIKAPGATTWTAATVGMTIVPLATISTGFDSTATVTIDKNNIYVKPLTRISIDKLIEESGTVTTNVFLRVGSTTTSVKSSEGVKQAFNVSSPYSTASVRGTEFDYNGVQLNVTEGLVALSLGRPNREGGNDNDYAGAPDFVADSEAVTLVEAGESAVLSVNSTVAVSTDQSSLVSQTSVTASGSSRPETQTGTATNAPTYGSVTVTWTVE